MNLWFKDASITSALVEGDQIFSRGARLLHDQQSIRDRNRSRRKDLDSSQIQILSSQICDQIRSHEHYRNAESIAAYLAFAGEVNLHELLNDALCAGKQLFLPVIDGECMHFQPTRSVTDLPTNRFGIPQPETDPAQFRSPDTLDLILMPLLACDDAGHRIGMGGGYYDRCLAETAALALDQRPTRVGIAYAWQTCENIEPNPWDVPLDAVVTEAGWRWF